MPLECFYLQFLFPLIVFRPLHSSNKMRGFMCHSVEATSVCTITDPRYVIVPRRPDRTSEDHSRLISNARYSRLVEPHRFDPPSKCITDPRSVIVPRRPDRTSEDHSRLIRNARYSRLAERHTFDPPSKRSVNAPSIKRNDQAVKSSLETVKQPHLLTSSRSLIVPSVKSDHQAVKPSMEGIRQPHLRSSSRSAIVPSVKGDQAAKPSMEAIKQPHLLNSSDNVFQVVVMRVSLHCQGCAGKVKKHLSRMEGVTSFSIDLESKRVTVMGHISPNGVLESISKVKRAEFWTS